MPNWTPKGADDPSMLPGKAQEWVVSIAIGVVPVLVALLPASMWRPGPAVLIWLLVIAVWGAIVAVWLYRRARAYRLGFERAVGSGTSLDEVVSAVWVRLVDEKEDRVGVFTRAQLVLVPRSDFKPVERLPLSSRTDLKSTRTSISWTMGGRRMKTAKGTKENAAAREVEALLLPA